MGKNTYLSEDDVARFERSERVKPLLRAFAHAQDSMADGRAGTSEEGARHKYLNRVAAALGRIGANTKSQHVREDIAQALLVALTQNDASVRAAAVVGLGNIRDEEGSLFRLHRHLLEAALKDGVESVGDAARQVLTNFDRGAVVDAMEFALLDSQTTVRLRAVGVLTELRAAGALYGAALQNEDEATRRAAIAALGEMGDPRFETLAGSAAVDLLVASLKKEPGFPQAWRGPADTLAARLRTEDAGQASDVLISSLEEPHQPGFRGVAAITLGRLGDRRAIAALATLLDDEPRVLGAAASALGRLGGIEAVGILRSALESEYPAARSAAAEALDQAGWQPATPRDAVMFWAARGDWERCVDMGSNSVDGLIDVLELREISGGGPFPSDVEPSPARAPAARALGRIGDPRAVRPLISSLREVVYEDYGNLWAARSIGVAAVEALGRFDDPRAFEVLADVLTPEKAGSPSRDSSGLSPIREAAARVLGETQARSGVDALITALERDDSGEVRRAAAEALGRIGEPRSIGALRKALVDFSDPFGKWHAAADAAAAALGRIDHTDAFDALHEAASQPHARASVAQALGSSRDEAAADALQAMLSLRSDTVREAVIEALRRRADNSAIDALCLALDDPQPRIRMLAADALAGADNDYAGQAVLSAFKQARTSTLKGRLIDVLGRIGDPCAVEALVASLGTTDSHLQKSIVKALGEIGEPRAVNALVRHGASQSARALGLIGDPRAVEPLVALLPLEKAAEALGRIGNARAVNPLIKTLEDVRDRMETARMAAAEALGRIGDPSAVDSLATALHDRESRVRACAALALGQIEDPKAFAAVEALLGAREEKDVERVKLGDFSALDARVGGRAMSYDPRTVAMMFALGQGGERQSREALTQLLQRLTARAPTTGGEELYCRALVHSISRSPRSDAVGVISACLRSNPSSTARDAAAVALGRIGGQHCVQALRGALHDQDGRVRSAARRALRQAGAVAT